jgi:hypothetical protein
VNLDYRQSSSAATIIHSMVLVNAPPGAFTNSSDLTTAHLDASSGSPKLSGSLDYSGGGSASTKCGKKQDVHTTGNTTGSITAKFDIGGTQTFGGDSSGNAYLDRIG